MKKIGFLVLVLISSVLFLASISYAFPVSEYFLLGEQNLLSDDSWEELVDNSTPVGTVDEGDVLRGVLKFAQLKNTDYSSGITYNETSTTWNEELVAYFEIEVKTKSGNSTDGYDWTFGAVGSDTGSMVWIYTDANNDFSINGDYTTAKGTVTNGSLFWELGLTGADGEGWVAEAGTDTIASIGQGSGNTGTYNYALNLTGGGVGPKVAEIQKNLVVDLVFGWGPDDYVEFSGNGNLVSKASSSPAWVDAEDDVNLEFSPIPEPGTFALVGLGMLGIAGLYRRRS